jgi:metalloendopeptidase OMA1, mitochondrial
MNSRSMKTSRRARLLLASIAALVVVACATAPITGRKQFILTSESEEAQLGVQAFNETLKTSALSKNATWTKQVETVGRAIADVANRPDFRWEFKVVADSQINAFCLPGGKVAFYEGILPVCGSENGIAVVMGHEVGHAIARHGGERISQGLLAEQGVGVVAQILGGQDAEKQKIAATALGAGVHYGAILPFSRKQESEADEIGLALMADAGYDPREAPKFWERMIQATGGSGTAEWLSTHPDPQNRIARLNELMPDAVARFEAAKKKKAAAGR